MEASRRTTPVAPPPGTADPLAYRAADRRLAEDGAGLRPVELVLLSSFGTDLLDPFLRVEGARHGYGVGVHRGGFGQLETALLEGTWPVRPGAPEVLVLALRIEDMDPDAVPRFHAGDGSVFRERVGEALDRLQACVELYRKRSRGPVLVANFAPPTHLPLRVFDAGVPGSLTGLLAEANLELARRVHPLPDVTVWDYAGLVASRGAADWTDPRLWALARLPVAARHHPVLASHLARTLRGILTPPAKCLVLDLDHTLWGGAVGDDGVGGIVLGDDHPGSAFKAFQREVLGLRDRGVLLAIASKNDPDVVTEALESHPEMLVAPDDFAAIRVSWGPKSVAVREIAEELGIGLDSLVFFDDNPVEREEVRRGAPDVTVVEVPGDPADYVAALHAVPDFDTPWVTPEDLERSRTHGARRRGEASLRAAASPGEFLETLAMEASVGRLGDGTARRIAQLVAKTNQFNLTTRRRTLAELEALAARDDAAVLWLRLRDRFGDLGLVAVGILVEEGSDGVVDTLLMSCRVAGRGVERAMAALLAREARARGLDALVGDHVPTARNGVVAGLWESLGFAAADVPEGAPEGSTRWRLDLSDSDVAWPASIGRPEGGGGDE